MVVANNKIDGDKKYKSNTGNFNDHVDTAVQCRAHRPMEHICGFMQSHWMPPLGESHAVLPRWPPWSTVWNETKKH
jgi:hypothetical protein